MAAQDVVVSDLKLQIVPLTLSGGETAKGRLTVTRDTRIRPTPLQFKLESTDASVIAFRIAEVTIPETQNSVQFDIPTAATAIRKSVTVRALLGPKFSQQASAAVDVVPALLSRVTLSAATMNGTKGTTIQCTAELKAPAPAGGIELYLSPLVFSPSSGVKPRDDFGLANPRVAEGSRTAVFAIRYNDLVSAYSSFLFSDRDFSTTFESVTRHVDLVVALDPQTTKPWQPITNRAIKVGFDLVPLRVVSFSIQPASVAGGGEALGTFTLNMAPGSGENVTLSAPSRLVLKIVPIGSSCSSAGLGSGFDLSLAAGVMSHSFKACAQPVTSSTSASVKVFMRSGEYTASATVTP
jgi:hypothetical protein